MKRRESLLRLKRFRVDEMKRRIAAIDAMKVDLERKLTDLDDNVAREKQRAGDSDIQVDENFLQSQLAVVRYAHRYGVSRDVAPPRFDSIGGAAGDSL